GVEIFLASQRLIHLAQSLRQTEVKPSVDSLESLMGCEASCGMQLLEKHSIIRYHQQRPTDLDPNCASLYGIPVSYSLPEIAPGRAITIYRKDTSKLVFKDTTTLSQGKRCTTKDLETIYEQKSNVAIKPDVKFAHIYNHKKAAVMAALEEGITDIWYAGQMFLLGDAAHKMLPHNAMGASQAMKSAARWNFEGKWDQLHPNPESHQDM
ncbi:FAD-dependent monooxygenase bik2, partial [Talaromyces pinophilus]